MNRILSYILLFTFSISCTNSKNTENNTTEHTKQISVSILPQQYIVDRLTNKELSCNVLVLPGNSPASYSPTAKQMQELHLSEVYIRVGHIGFENAWIDRFKETNPNLSIENASEGIDFAIIEEQNHGDHTHEEGIDPHIWTSPKQFKKLVENTQKILAKHYPELKSTINKNAKELLSEVEKIDQQFEKELKTYKGKSFLIFHPAYGYLAKDYGINQLSIEKDGKEPSMRWMKEIVEDADAKNINTIFIQREFDSRNAELISSELGLKVVVVDPLNYSWTTEMQKLLESLVTAFAENS